MPERKNRTRRSMLWVCALAAMVLLAALPATAAWYATQSAAAGSAIKTATFEVEADTRPQTESVSLTQSDLADLTEKYGEDAVNALPVGRMDYQTTVVTVTADEKNTASGYVIVTYNNSNNSENYYSGFVAPGESVCFTVPGGTVRGSDGEITISGKDALSRNYSNDFHIEAGWGRPEERPTLEELQDALDAQTDSLIARQKQAYLEALEAQLEQAKQAAEEAARKAAEEAASQAGQNTTEAATTEPTGDITGS